MASSPFNWSGQPSILTAGRGDPAFSATKDGLSRSQIASRTVRQRTQATGVSPGAIFGLSPKADKQLLLRAKAKR